MGLLSKIKNVLFEEEEIEIPVFTKEEKKVEEKPIRKIEKTIDPVKKENIEQKLTKKEKIEEDNERETFKTEPTFQFPIFEKQSHLP